MGATEIISSCIWHACNSAYEGGFKTKEDTEKIKANVDRALKFTKFLKAFEKTIKD
jgi:hypothetical protein